MSAISNIYYGRVTSIIDEESWLITVDFMNQAELGEKGPPALPLGFISSEVKKDDKILVFETDQKPGTFFYMPLKNDGRVTIRTGNSYIDITDPDEFIIQASDKMYMMNKGDLFINVSKNMKILGPGGKLEVKGVVVPNSNPGPFCAIPNCLFAGNPHSTYEITLTEPPEQPKDPPEEQ